MCSSNRFRKYLLCGLNWFGIKVSLCIYRCLFLCFGGVAGIHIIWRNGSSNGTEAGHWDLENFSIKFLEWLMTICYSINRHLPAIAFEHLYIKNFLTFSPVWATNTSLCCVTWENLKKFIFWQFHHVSGSSPYVPMIQKYPRKVCESNAALPLKQLRN